MTTAARGRPQNMAKVQKTVFIPEDLYELLQEEERSKGASISRVITAALLQRYFRDAAGPAEVWMRMAIALEKGELELTEIPLRAVEAIYMNAHAAWHEALSAKSDEQDCKLLHHLYMAEAARHKQWAERLDREGEQLRYYKVTRAGERPHILRDRPMNMKELLASGEAVEVDESSLRASQDASAEE